MLLVELVGAEATMLLKRMEEAEAKLYRDCRRAMVDCSLEEDESNCPGLQV